MGVQPAWTGLGCNTLPLFNWKRVSTTHWGRLTYRRFPWYCMTPRHYFVCFCFETRVIAVVHSHSRTGRVCFWHCPTVRDLHPLLSVDVILLCLNCFFFFLVIIFYIYFLCSFLKPNCIETIKHFREVEKDLSSKNKHHMKKTNSQMKNKK